MKIYKKKFWIDFKIQVRSYYIPKTRFSISLAFLLQFSSQMQIPFFICGMSLKKQDTITNGNF